MKYHPITLLHKKQGLELIRKLMSFLRTQTKKTQQLTLNLQTQLNPTLRSYLRFNKHMAKLIGFYPQTNAGHRHCAQYQFLGISVRFIGEFLKFLRILISALADLST